MRLFLPIFSFVILKAIKQEFCYRHISLNSRHATMQFSNGICKENLLRFQLQYCQFSTFDDVSSIVWWGGEGFTFHVVAPKWRKWHDFIAEIIKIYYFYCSHWKYVKFNKNKSSGTTVRKVQVNCDRSISPFKSTDSFCAESVSNFAGRWHVSSCFEVF